MQFLSCRMNIICYQYFICFELIFNLLLIWIFKHETVQLSAFWIRRFSFQDVTCPYLTRTLICLDRCQTLLQQFSFSPWTSETSCGWHSTIFERRDRCKGSSIFCQFNPEIWRHHWILYGTYHQVRFFQFDLFQMIALICDFIKHNFGICPVKQLRLYSVRRLIGSRMIESSAYCNQIFQAPLYLNSA